MMKALALWFCASVVSAQSVPDLNGSWHIVGALTSESATIYLVQNGAELSGQFVAPAGTYFPFNSPTPGGAYGPFTAPFTGMFGSVLNPGAVYIYVQAPAGTVTFIGGAGSDSISGSVPFDWIASRTQPPVITGALNAASYLPGFTSGSWVEIAGTNLSQTTRQWTSTDFVGGNLPTELDGVSVNIHNIPAYIFYISPTQINALAPDDLFTGQVQVQVNNAQGTSFTFAANKAEFAPAFFLFTARYPAAVHTNGVYVGPTGLIAGAAFAPVKPGEAILLFGTGFGPTDPPLPAGELVSKAEPLTYNVTVTVGGEPATVLFAGLSGSGLDQLNVTMPDNLPDGDAVLVATVNGVSSQPNIFLSVQH